MSYLPRAWWWWAWMKTSRRSGRWVRVWCAYPVRIRAKHFHLRFYRVELRTAPKWVEWLYAQLHLPLPRVEIMVPHMGPINPGSLVSGASVFRVATVELWEDR